MVTSHTVTLFSVLHRTAGTKCDNSSGKNQTQTLWWRPDITRSSWWTVQTMCSLHFHLLMGVNIKILRYYIVEKCEIWNKPSKWCHETHSMLWVQQTPACFDLHNNVYLFWKSKVWMENSMSNSLKRVYTQSISLQHWNVNSCEKSFQILWDDICEFVFASG